MEHITSKNNRWIRLAIRLKQKKYRDKNKMFLMEGLRNAEDVQNQEISDIVCLVQSGRAENGSVQHSTFLNGGKICTGYFVKLKNR